MSHSTGVSDSTCDPRSGDLEALRRTFERARRSPFYAERFRDQRIGSLDEFRDLPLTTREDLAAAGVHGMRALPLERVCHYGESSGTTGQPSSTWLSPEDLASNARRIAARHPEVFGPGRILLNRFPFMAAPAHLVQLIAQQGNGVSIPAGNINWDVPFPRALDLARRTGAQVIAGLPLEPIVLAGLARAQGLDPAKDFAIDTFFLGGAPLPPVLQQRIERIWGARVIELYGSTETMLLGTGCKARGLHLEPELAFCEILHRDTNAPVAVGEVGRLVVTTLGIEGSPLLRLDTGDRVRREGACPCGDPRPRVVVLGRESDRLEIGDRQFDSYEVIEAGAAAADAVGSSVFFCVALPGRLLVRIETDSSAGDPEAAVRAHLGALPVEIERTGAHTLLDIEQLSRSPSVYKPVLVSDWRRPGRHVLSVSQGMIEWPRPSLNALGRLLGRGLRSALRARSLRREIRVEKPMNRRTS